MALKDIWTRSRQELETRNIQQIISWAGDGHLRDGSAAATDFREYLELIPASLLSQYCQQCLDEAFQESGLALQDLINHVGKRLGFEVEFGRYRGNQQFIGFDGIWRFPSGHQAVIEVKTTSAYQLRLETIATYRLTLVEQGRLSEDRSSILIVVGRDDTSDLEAQIRGSRYAWDIRLISVDALLRLLAVKEELEDPNIVKQIHEILIPREFTKLDEITEVLFTTAADLRSGVESGAEHVAVEASADVDEPSAVAVFHARSLEKIQKKLKVALITQTRSSFASVDGATIVVCKASRAYEHRDGTCGYWFGFYEFQMEMITKCIDWFCCFSMWRAGKSFANSSKPSSIVDRSNEPNSVEEELVLARAYRRFSIGEKSRKRFGRLAPVFNSLNNSSPLPLKSRCTLLEEGWRCAFRVFTEAQTDQISLRLNFRPFCSTRSRIDSASREWMDDAATISSIQSKVSKATGNQGLHSLGFADVRVPFLSAGNVGTG
jgi:hypothetical protein